MQVVHLKDYGFVPDIIGTSCTNSIQLKDVDFRVPCGKCLPCQKKRRSEWSLRLEHEYMFSDSAFFITLTYNDESLPRTKQGFPTLVKKHVQDYIKRLRNAHVAYLKKEQEKVKNEFKIKSKSIRYYTVGEYGSQTRRPHYHLLLFNYDIANISPFTSKWKNTQTQMSYGHVDVGTVTSASINYVTKYMFKGFNKKTDKRQRPFSLMSKKPIIGHDYLVNYGTHHIQNETLEVRDQNGGLRRIPKAYLRRLFTNKEDRRELSKKNHDEFIKSKMKRYEENILKYYNGDSIQYERSLESDLSRLRDNINFKETI